MSKMIQAVRGMNDLLPDKLLYWQAIEKHLIACVHSYSYREMRLPIVESTGLFKRSIGEVTDIVEKEMYTFDDRNGESLTLRPEGTAGCVRACLEHSLLNRETQRLWYLGPMFRYERPQKGRYRQFNQFGVEAFGFDGIDIEIEILLMSARFWRDLGLDTNIHLEINTLGTLDDRKVYRQVLVEYFKRQYEKLDSDSRRRLEANPLRILDSKNPDMQALILDAPQMMDTMSAESRERFEQLCHQLSQLGIEYSVNTRLVRGLDYYSHLVFEWVSNDLGAQGTVCAGGRYDKLVKDLGGRESHAVGFAMGMERLVLLYEQSLKAKQPTDAADIYILTVGEGATAAGYKLSEKLRDNCPKLRMITHCGGGSFKSQFKKADKSGAAIALILGEEEIEQETIGVKFLREQRDQASMTYSELLELIKDEWNNHTA